MESKDFSIRNTPIETNQHNSNVTTKKSSEDLFVKNDPTLERTKSLSSKIAIDSYQVDDLEGHSAEKSESHIDSSVLKFDEVVGQNQMQRQSKGFDSLDEDIEKDIPEPDWGYADDSDSKPSNDWGYADDSDSKPSNDFGYADDSKPSNDFGYADDSKPSNDFGYADDSKPSNDFGYAYSSDSADDKSPMESKYQYGSLDTPKNSDGYQVYNKLVESKDEIPKMQKIPKKRSALQTETKEQKDNSRLEHLFQVCSSSLKEGSNLLKLDFKTPDNHKLYTDTIVTTINTSQDKKAVVEKLGAGSNKTTFAASITFKEKSKSFALTSGSIDNKFLQTELALAKKIRELELKGAVKTYGIMENGNNFIIVSKKADMGTMSGLLIDDKKGLSLLLDAHANIKEFHDAGISHNDIKLSNFLVHKGSKENEKILLNDFGSSIIGAKKEGARMTSTYVLDPYTLRNSSTVKIESYPESDKYAYGLSIIEFLRRNSNAPIDTESDDLDIRNRFAPWVNNNQMTDEECSSFVNNLIENTPIPAQVPELHDLLKSLMAFNPADRPSNLVIQEQIAGIKAKLA